MKQVFWLHSHITFIVAKEIINKHIDIHDEVIIFTSRCYKLPQANINRNFELIEFPWYREMGNSEHNILVKNDIVRTRNNVKMCKKLFEKYIKDEEFILYIPTSFEYSIGILLQNSFCTGYYYLEEGTLSYQKDGNKKKKNIWFKLIAKIIYNIPYLGYYALQNNFMGTFGTNPKAFPWNENKKYTLTIENDLNLYYNYYWIEILVVFDHLNLEDIELSVFIDKLCQYFKDNKINRFAYKFHPVTKNKIGKENIIRNKFNQFQSLELPQDFVVELFLIEKKITMYSIISNSSLSIYAKRYGSDVFLVKSDSEAENLKILLL